MHLEIWAIWLCSTTIELTHSNWLINDDSFRCTQYRHHHRRACYLWMQHCYMQRCYNYPFSSWKRNSYVSTPFRSKVSGRSAVDRSGDFKINSTIPVIIIVVITLCAADLNNGATNSQSTRQPTDKKSSSINESVSSCLSNTTSITLKLYMTSEFRWCKIYSRFWSLTQSDTSHTTRSIKILDNNSCVVWNSNTCTKCRNSEANCSTDAD